MGILAYLTRKNNNQPLSCGIINEVALYNYDDPDQLTAMNESMMGENEEWYFFMRRGRKDGNCAVRTAGNGVWKASRKKQKPVTYEGAEVGHKTHLVFWYRNPTGVKKEVKTKSLMTEFGSGDGENFDNWVLWKVYKNSKGVKEAQVNNHTNMINDEGLQVVTENVENNQLGVVDNVKNNQQGVVSEDGEHNHQFEDPELCFSYEELYGDSGIFREAYYQQINNYMPVEFSSTSNDVILQPQVEPLNNISDLKFPTTNFNDMEDENN